MSPTSDAAVRLPRKYDPELLQRDLQTLQEVRRAPQPGPYHQGEWTGIALYSMGGKQSTFPSAAGTDLYQETEELKQAPYFRQILRELVECPKEVVRILFLPPQGHIKDHFDFHTSFQFGLLRLHVPIMTHPDVIFLIDGQRVGMNPGELWYGDFSKVHSVQNNSTVVRVHMVIDVQINEFVLSLFPEDFVARRRAEGISITTDPLPAPEAQLSPRSSPHCCSCPPAVRQFSCCTYWQGNATGRSFCGPQSSLFCVAGLQSGPCTASRMHRWRRLPGYRSEWRRGCLEHHPD